jgi:hypothetical protein
MPLTSWQWKPPLSDALSWRCQRAFIFFFYDLSMLAGWNPNMRPLTEYVVTPNEGFDILPGHTWYGF